MFQMKVSGKSVRLYFIENVVSLTVTQNICSLLHAVLGLLNKSSYLFWTLVRIFICSSLLTVDNEL